MEYYKKECLYCGKEYLVEKARIEKAKCCSKECFNKFRKDNPDYSGDNNYNWKGKIKRSGYWYIKDLKHPNGGKQNYIAEHRIVMEKKLGRYLDKKEIVHHKDGDKENNNVDNLELCESRGKHSRDQHARNYSEMAYKYWETQPKTVEFKGKKYRKIELAKKYGINYETFLNRLKSGWRIEKAIQNKSFIGNNQYSKK